MSDHPGIDRATLVIMTAAAGLTVANNYYNQAMLGHLARDFQLSAAAVAALPVLTQLGNVAGILFLAPLGDRLNRRNLILTTLGALICALVAAALSPGFGWLLLAGVCIGLSATVTQQIVPFAVHLAAPSQRGRVLGVVTGGILIGILLARTVSGVITDIWGWRAVFWIAAAAMLATAAAVAIRLPHASATTDLGYRRLLASLWTLFRTHEALRRSVIVQALIFSAFIAFWSTIALELASAPYHLGATAVGLLALTGVAGALCAPLAGGAVDARGPGQLVAGGAGLVLISFGLIGVFQGSLLVLIIGVLVLDLAVQASQVANQTLIHALDPTARSRLNTIFMAVMVLGGACGSALGGAAFSLWGWTGVCAYGAIASATALWLARRPRR